VVNLGIGIPEGVAAVAAEEGIGDQLVLTIESGLIGGIPVGGESFGSAYNAWAALQMTSQFDYYNGGNLNITSLGFAEIDPMGNVNVSRFGAKIAGAGGFIDISQSTKKIVFSGTMTAGGLKVQVRDGKLSILQEGKKKKFLPSIDQITFSADFSKHIGQTVLFVTERCVFQVTGQGLMLTEIAPGIDVEKDILPCMDFRPAISPDLKQMDPRIFQDQLMGLGQIIGIK
jgi:propionate CoA-transferase